MSLDSPWTHSFCYKCPAVGALTKVVHGKSSRRRVGAEGCKRKIEL